MDKFKVEFLGMVTIFVISVLLASHLTAAEVENDHNRKPAQNDTDLICNGNFRRLYKYCKRSIKASRVRHPRYPSQYCCQTIRAIDLYCICREIPPRLEMVVSMKKVALTARRCQQRIRRRTRCGSYIVPAFQLADKKLQPPPPPKAQEEWRALLGFLDGFRSKIFNNKL